MSDAHEQNPCASRTRGRRFLGLAVVQLDVTVVNVAVEQIGGSLGGGLSVMQWVLSAYTQAVAALILTAGALDDRIGSIRLFIAGFTIFTVASTACGLAPSIAVLIAERAVQGIGAAVLVACSLAILNTPTTMLASARRRSGTGQRARAPRSRLDRLSVAC